MKNSQLINLLVNEEQQQVLKKLSTSMPEVILNDRQICDFELLTTGVFSPLTGFMKQIDYESVLDRMRLESGELWPIPICLDIPESLGLTLETGQSITLRDAEGFLLGIMNIEDIWPMEIKKEALAVYGTTDKIHPGVEYLYNKSGKYYIGGEIQALSLPIHSDFKQIRNTPAEVRKTFFKLGWKRIVGFQTRQPIHRPQFEMTIQAMQQAKANLLLLPIAGVSKKGDFDHFTRMRCYQKVAAHYPPDSYVLNLLPMAMRMAGPREAILHMIIGRNFGCTHFVIGHNHASPGSDSTDKPFYKYDDATILAQKATKELGVKIITFEEMIYLPFEDEYKIAGQVPKDKDTISFTGADIQTRIRKGKKIPDWASFPEVIKELQKS